MGRGRQAIDYRPDIDGLRAVAVGCVIIYHSFPHWMPGGFIGVDVFFVISGFLISGIILRNLANGTFSFVGFCAGRIRRIVPSLVLTLAATWSIGWFILLSPDYQTLGRHTLAASTFVSNFVLAQEQGYFAAEAAFKPLLHLWSLAVEEQFYLIWPAALYLIWRLGWSPLPILLVVALVSLGWSATPFAHGSVFNFYSPQTRLWELAVGALLACTMTVGGELRDRHGLGDGLALIGLFSIAVSVFAFDASFPYPSWRAMLPVLGGALFIVAGPRAWINQRILSRDAVVFVGLISYPLYLWHWPLLSFANIMAEGKPTVLLRCGIIAVSVAAAWVSYQFVERPIRFGKYSVITWQRYVPATLLSLLCAIGAIGLITERRDGFIGRFPDPVQYLANYKFDTTLYRDATYRDTCLLYLDQDYHAFGNCVDNDGPNRPLLMLWGDSHAAQLYSGLREIQRDAGFSLAQFTAGACPPAPGIKVPGHRACPEINDFVVAKIKELRPAAVIMAASWWAYPNTQYEALSNTISELKKAGIERIWIVGPVPVWNPSLPGRLIEFYKTSSPARVPYRMQGAQTFTDIDQILREIATTLHVGFVSAIDAFCNPEGCVTRTGEGPEGLVVWDAAHLTKAGSRLLADRIRISVSASLVARSPTHAMPDDVVPE
jgi:peptidoglycan/LPS O-acetylase OafA/YrhL